MTEDRQATVGDFVLYVDESGIKHCGIVSAVFGPEHINIIYVSENPLKTDEYGRQIERGLTVSNRKMPGEHPCRYWEFLPNSY